MLTGSDSPTDWEEVVLQSILAPVSPFFSWDLVPDSWSISMIQNMYYLTLVPSQNHSLSFTRG
jgi:hypothetical protein